MKIHLLSDLHVEFWKHANKRTYLESLLQPADVCVLAGDIHVGRHNVLEVIRHISASNLYQHILYVPGNHEYYSGTKLGWFNEKDFVDKLPPNAYLLDPGVRVIDNVRFIGATLFTNFRNGDPLVEQAAKWGINDFAGHRTATIREYKELYTRDAAFMKAAYEWRKPDEKIVFISHFVPDISLCHPKWGGESSLMNFYFANQLSDWMSHLEPCHWLFGHTHDNVDQMIGDCHCIANPLGYPGEKVYEPKVIEV